MIDHILGRPSPRFRKYQVFSVVLLWSFYLYKVDRNGPPFVRRLSVWLSKRFSVHQIVVASAVALYVSRNFARVVGLESPEPLANLYTRDYFRATWVTTALDAGFWTAMHLRPKWFRHIASILFTFYYLACAEQADEMVRRVRGAITVHHMRVSWDKSQTPILKFANNMLRPKFMTHKPRPFFIERPAQSEYRAPIRAWLYFNGTTKELKQHDKVVLDIPGGGFVAMNPRCHDDKLMAWAGKLGYPVVALDYKKAPEAPYPYALNECYDTYFQIVATRGRCVGLSGDTIPKIIVSGDSAGGNLAVATMLMLLDSESETGTALPMPEALVAIYPALEMSIGSWMSDEQLALLKRPSQRRDSQKILEQKNDEFQRMARETPRPSDVEFEAYQKAYRAEEKDSNLLYPINGPKTKLAMSSMISYVNDRILSPEMLRAMILMYVGPTNRPDLATDYLLSPLRAPEALLARFPKTFLICGERDPLVDDTAIFAGRLRQAHMQEFLSRQELGLEPEDAVFDDKKHVEVVMIDGISHGFMQFVGVYPKGWDYIHHCSRWMRKVFDEREMAQEPQSSARKVFDEREMAQEPQSSASNVGGDYFGYAPRSPSRHRRPGSVGGSSTSGEDRPLEISSKLRMTRINTNLNTGVPKKRNSFAKHPRGGYSGRGGIHRPHSRRSPRDSMVRIQKLGSQEDLLARRMMNVTENMMDDRTPRTPYA